MTFGQKLVIGPGGIQTYVDLTPEEIAQRQAEQAAAIAEANNPRPILNWAQGYVSNLKIWILMLKAMDDTRAAFALSPTPTAQTILANLRAQVSAVVAVIATGPQGLQDALTRERILEGSTMPDPLNQTAINAMTAAECRIILDVCQKAAAIGVGVCAGAFLAPNVDLS